MKITMLALTRPYPVDFAAELRRLLRRLPPEHLAGLSRIVVSGGRPLDERHGEEILGQYFEAYEGEPAFIMLYPEEMAGDLPSFLRKVPTVWRVVLAETLYHEVGHHYQRFTHGIRKPAQEDHAESYGLRHARAAFPAVYRFLDGWRRLRTRVRRVQRWWLERQRNWGRASAASLYELGRIHWEGRDWLRVIEAWEGALALDPGYAVAVEWLPRARRRLQIESRRSRGGIRPARRRRPRRRRRR